MKGQWKPSDDNGYQGTYVDTRGVPWTVTSDTHGDGVFQQRKWMAQSEGDDDARKYFTRTGWTIRTRGDLFDDVDTFVTGSAAAKRSNVGGLVLLAFAAYILLDERKR